MKDSLPPRRPWARMRALAAIASLLLTFGLAGCGESKEEKAEKSICASRKVIDEKVEHLKTLSPSTQALTELRESGKVIAEELKKMVASSKELGSTHQQEIQNAVSAFERSSAEAFAALAKGGSATQLQTELKGALEGFATAYKTALANIKCS